MTNAEARFNNSLRPRKPEGSLGRTAQDVHLDSHTAPELCQNCSCRSAFIYLSFSQKTTPVSRVGVKGGGGGEGGKTLLYTGYNLKTKIQ